MAGIRNWWFERVVSSPGLNEIVCVWGSVCEKPDKCLVWDVDIKMREKILEEKI